MPSRHNNLKEKLPMTFTIENIYLYEEFYLNLEAQQMNLSFRLQGSPSKTRVTINSAGFEQSLENLKALIEGKEIPHV